MSGKKQYFSNLYDLLICMTKAIDLVSPEVTDHHQQVAYLAYNIADAMQIPTEAKRKLMIAALLHDVGAIAFQKNLDFVEEERSDINEHAFLGARLLGDFPVFKDVSTLIRFHHIPWDNGKGQSYKGQVVPLLAHVIHFADRIAVQLNRHDCVISQIASIREYIIDNRGSLFPPDVVDAFLPICDREAMWLDLIYQPTVANITSDLSLDTIKLTLDEVVDLTQVFARIIDFRSQFTAMHSAGVAATAVKLAELSGFSEDECKMMHIAGNLHDIGKLAIPQEIIEKQDKLEPAEYDIIRSHTFYTYKLLKPISGFEDIAQWAAYHHEKLNGHGYPFHLKGHALSLGARIMAVADIFTAITENRPYRDGMGKDQAISILLTMAENNGISAPILSLLIENYEEVLRVSKLAAEQAVSNYSLILDRDK